MLMGESITAMNCFTSSCVTGCGNPSVEGVVGTLMTNYSLERRLRELDIPFARARVGDRYVLEMLEEKKMAFRWRGSGHLLCLDCHTTGDGIVSALQVCRQCAARIIAGPVDVMTWC